MTNDFIRMSARFGSIKNDIMTSINKKGRQIDENTPFWKYATEINKISTPVTLTNGVKFGFSTFDKFPGWLQNASWANVGDFSNMFNDCYSLTTVPKLTPRLQKGGGVSPNMSAMFQNCSSLKSLPNDFFDNFEFNTSTSPSLTYMFASSGIITHPEFPNYILEASSVDCNGIFSGCRSLLKVEHNFSNAFNIDYAFAGCVSLPCLILSLESIQGSSYPFGDSYSDPLTSLFLLEIEGAINYSLDLSPLTVLDKWSVLNVLYAADESEYETSEPRELIFGGLDIYDEDGEFQTVITSLESKGWTITGLNFIPNEIIYGEITAEETSPGYYDISVIDSEVFDKVGYLSVPTESFSEIVDMCGDNLAAMNYFKTNIGPNISSGSSVSVYNPSNEVLLYWAYSSSKNIYGDAYGLELQGIIN